MGNEVCAWNVPLPLPNKTLTEPWAHSLVAHSLGTMRSSEPSPFTSATASICGFTPTG